MGVVQAMVDTVAKFGPRCDVMGVEIADYCYRLVVSVVGYNAHPVVPNDALYLVQIYNRTALTFMLHKD